AVDQHPGFVEVVVGVAADVRAPVDHQHALVEAGGQALGEHAAGEAGADDQVVVALAGAAGGGTAGALGLGVMGLQSAHRIFSCICVQVWSQDMSPRMRSVCASRLSVSTAAARAASQAAMKAGASSAIQTSPLSP